MQLQQRSTLLGVGSSDSNQIVLSHLAPNLHPLQMTDVLRRYPDAAPACVDTIAAIPEEVCLGACSAVLPLLGLALASPDLSWAPAPLMPHRRTTLPPHLSVPAPTPLNPGGELDHHTHQALPARRRPLQEIVEAPARAAYLWVLGEYGAQIQDAPYVLEELAGSYADEEPPAKLVRCCDWGCGACGGVERWGTAAVHTVPFPCLHT